TFAGPKIMLEFPDSSRILLNQVDRCPGKCPGILTTAGKLPQNFHTETPAEFEDGCGMDAVDFLFRFCSHLFSASCKTPCRMDTGYVQDGCNNLRVCIL